jgi:hypothetical protein
MNVDKGQRSHLTQPEHHAAGMLNDTGWTVFLAKWAVKLSA